MSHSSWCVLLLLFVLAVTSQFMNFERYCLLSSYWACHLLQLLSAWYWARCESNSCLWACNKDFWSTWQLFRYKVTIETTLFHEFVNTDTPIFLCSSLTLLVLYSLLLDWLWESRTCDRTKAYKILWNRISWNKKYLELSNQLIKLVELLDMQSG